MKDTRLSRLTFYVMQARRVSNLLVADFHTYFVGSDMAFSHDLTFAQPTDVLVSGLAPIYETPSR